MENTSAVIGNKLPQKPTLEDIAKHINYMQEQYQFQLTNQNKKIKELQDKVAVLEGT